MEDKGKNVDEVEKIEIDEDLEIVKDAKTNETIMKEKVNDILKDLDDSEIVYRRRNRRKTILFVIGIIIEIFVIILIIKNRYIKKDVANDNVKMVVTCSNTTQNDAYSASIKTNNIYYFNDDNEVIKRENEVLYAFNNKDAYDRYKSDYVNTDIKDFKGLKQQSIFSDENNLFKTKTTYTYSELKNNNSVKFKNNIFTIFMPDDSIITLPIENYNEVLTTNENMNFICE